MTVKEEIAKNILYYRKKAGLTQKELAEQLNVRNSAVSNWENGNNSIDIEKLFEIVRLFDITINDLYGAYANAISNPVEITNEVAQKLKERPILKDLFDVLIMLDDEHLAVFVKMLDGLKDLQQM